MHVACLSSRDVLGFLAVPCLELMCKCCALPASARLNITRSSGGGGGVSKIGLSLGIGGG